MIDQASQEFFEDAEFQLATRLSGLSLQLKAADHGEQKNDSNTECAKYEQHEH